GANSNSATIAGAGSRWLLDDGLTVGGFGSSSRLVVSNGAALVTGSSCSIGNENISSNNAAVVTGPGSSWNCNLFTFVGFGGRNNSLLVAEGGLLANYVGSIGNSFADGSNNLATVTGAGSLWSNTFELYVGNVGAGSRLVVSNSAIVSAGS